MEHLTKSWTLIGDTLSRKQSSIFGYLLPQPTSANLLAFVFLPSFPQEVSVFICLCAGKGGGGPEGAELSRTAYLIPAWAVALQRSNRLCHHNLGDSSVTLMVCKMDQVTFIMASAGVLLGRLVCET